MEAGSAEEGGLPMFSLIEDPLVSLSPELYGVTPVGVKLIEMNGVTHVFDWVGAKHYPNAADFLEEAIRLGLSRRLSRSEDLSRLTPQSRLILIHPKGYVMKVGQGQDLPVPCPTGLHVTSEEGFNRRTEAGILWRMGEPKTLKGPTSDKHTPSWAPLPISAEGFYERQMPSFRYAIDEKPEGTIFAPGIIMVAPIERLCVVNDPKDRENFYASFDAAANANLPIIVGEE